MIEEMRGYLVPSLKDISNLYMSYLCRKEDEKKISSDVRIRFMRVEKLYFRGFYGMSCSWYRLRAGYKWLMDASREDAIKTYKEMINLTTRGKCTVSDFISISLFFIMRFNEEAFLRLVQQLESKTEKIGYNCIDLKELEELTKLIITKS